MGVSEQFTRTLEYLRRRRLAYKLAFSTKKIVTSARRAYRAVFGQYAGQEVLIDLAKFCRAAETCVVAVKGEPLDRDRSLVLEGRREVWLRIQQHMRLNQDQLFSLYAGNQFPVTDEDKDG